MCWATCEIDVGHIGAFVVLLTLCAVTHSHPAAVGSCVSSRGRRQDQLTVLVTLLDAGGGKQRRVVISSQVISDYSVAGSRPLRAAPEARVVEGVQVGRVRPPDRAAFAAQLHVSPRGQGCALAQALKTALIQNLRQQRVASSVFQFVVLRLHPLPTWSDAILPCVFPPLGLLAGTWIRRGDVWVRNVTKGSASVTRPDRGELLLVCLPAATTVEGEAVGSGCAEAAGCLREKNNVISPQTVRVSFSLSAAALKEGQQQEAVW